MVIGFIGFNTIFDSRDYPVGHLLFIMITNLTDLYGVMPDNPVVTL